MRIIAAAHNERGSVSEFWNAFASRARDQGGYDRDLLFAMAEEAGGEKFARALQRFETTVYARPDRRLRGADGSGDRPLNASQSVDTPSRLLRRTLHGDRQGNRAQGRASGAHC